MKTFLVSGNTVHIRDKNTVHAHDDLPVGTYTVKFSEQQGEFFLEMIENFTLPDKIYGASTDNAARILNTFHSRPGSTGVLLSGIKGAGKTLLAKQTSIEGLAIGIPTIVINKDWRGDVFNAFIQSISTPSIVLFDEFEKIYGWSEQRQILTLFDGVFNSRKLFLITTNEDRDVSEYLQNRPGRMYYNFKFDTLDQVFIKEYLDDRLDDKSQAESILKYTSVFSFFNFDMLAAAIEEMNRYGETLSQVLEVLNIIPENRKSDTFLLELIFGDQHVTLEPKYQGFQPNTFEYILWTDDDMPDAIKRGDPKVMDACTKMTKVSGSGKAPRGKTSNSIDALLGGEMDVDAITFNPETIASFDQATNKFIYAVKRNGVELELHVTRNETMMDWKYNPDM